VQFEGVLLKQVSKILVCIVGTNVHLRALSQVAVAVVLVVAAPPGGEEVAEAAVRPLLPTSTLRMTLPSPLSKRSRHFLSEKLPMMC